MTDTPDIGAMMTAAVPMVATMNLVFEEANAERAVVRMPDQTAFHNHVGGAHAGATFSLAETASGAVVMSAFAHVMDRGLPLAMRASIDYLKVAKGDITAEATIAADPDAVVAQLDSGDRPEFDVEVAVRNEAGDRTASFRITWTLKPIG